MSGLSVPVMTVRQADRHQSLAGPVQQSLERQTAKNPLSTQATGSFNISHLPVHPDERAHHSQQHLQPSAPSMEEQRSPLADVVGKGGGSPLAPGLQAELSERMGADFSGVRIHADADAARAAESVRAKAFTVKRGIFLSSDVPSLDSAEGKHILAHELTHTIQQSSQAVPAKDTGLGFAISHPTDSAEREAEANAAQVMRLRLGRWPQRLTDDMDRFTSTTQPASHEVPVVQRQPAGLPDMPPANPATRQYASREDTERTLTVFLHRVLDAQGGQELRITASVQQALHSLAAGDLDAGLRIDLFLADPPAGSPEEFAHKAALLLPPQIPRSRLDHLGQIPAIPSADPRAQSLAEATARVVEKDVDRLLKSLKISPELRTTIINAAREAVAEGAAALVDAAMTNAPVDPATKAAVHNAVEAALKSKSAVVPPPPVDDRYVRTPPPSNVPPAPSAPGEQLYPTPSINLPGDPAPVAPQTSEPTLPPEMEKVIAGLDDSALIPPESRGKPDAAHFAKAKAFARFVGEKLIAAQSAGGAVDMVIPEAYQGAQDIQASFDEFDRIVRSVADAAPDGASRVSQVVVTVEDHPYVRRVIRLHETH